MSSHSSKYAQYKDKNTIYPHRHCTVCNNMVPDYPHVEVSLEGAETHLIRGLLSEVARQLF